MIADLKNDGFRISLWQLPYFVPKNTLFNELVEKNLVVRDAKGNLPYEDVVLDFSNPRHGCVVSGQGWRTCSSSAWARSRWTSSAKPRPRTASSRQVARAFTNTTFIRSATTKPLPTSRSRPRARISSGARSAWAGSQRYPLHWGGDAESTDQGMAAELRGGLSFGVSGFTFWSHDVGGFTARASEDLYLRWLALGIFTSHTRCHGRAPKEPWEYSPAFMAEFRRAVELRYQLMLLHLRAGEGFLRARVADVACVVCRVSERPRSVAGG